jgi:hypothetical protein
MSISATPGTTSVTAPSLGEGAITSMSADSLLAYCQGQLGGLDDEITSQMNDQKLKLREQQALESVQKVVDSFGTAGPSDPAGFDQIEKAIADASASLPAGDPAAAQLQKFKGDLESQYGYTPGQPLTQADSDQIAAYQQQIVQLEASPPMGAHGVSPDGGMLAIQDLQSRIGAIQSKASSKVGHTPDSDKQEWKGTSEALSNDVQDLKSDAEIGLLQLQDLVSQRQQAVQLCTNMMSKVDDGLEDQAKAIGR